MLQKKCLAVINSLENFRPFLYGRKFILSCVHKPLKIINDARKPTARMTKWLLRLQDYEYDFECKPGKINRWLRGISENPTSEKLEKRDTEIVTTSESSDSQVLNKL